MTTSLEGGCACGAVRYRLTDTPLVVHCCHCKDCQRQLGSAFALNALIETSKDGNVAGRRSASTRCRPTAAGRTMSIAVRQMRHRHLVRLRPSRLSAVSSASARSTIPSAVTPDVQIYTRSRLPWVKPIDGVPAFEAFYDMRDVWRPEALARRKAASASAR